MPTKKVNINSKPAANADQWVATREVEPEAVEQPAKKMKRLTLDIPESLHRAIKMKAVESGVPMVDMLRELLEKHYGQ